MTGTLMLNGNWQPLKVISLKRAIVLVMQGKAEVLVNTDQKFRSASMEINVPDVIRLKYYVKIPYRAKIPLSRKNLLARDKGLCQYCFKPGDTVDHVYPRSRGGRHVWTNVVIACRKCNFKKGDKTLAELGWALETKPDVPHGTNWLILGVLAAKETPESWGLYLDPVM